MYSLVFIYVRVRCYAVVNCGTLTLLEEITNPKIKEVVQSVSSQDDTQHRTGGRERRITDIKKGAS